MKKILSFLAACLLFTPLYAQQIILNRQNARQELTALFQRADQATLRQTVQAQTLSLSQSLPGKNQLRPDDIKLNHFSHIVSFSEPTNQATQTPWQIAMFLAAADRPISETLGTLRYQMKQGNLKQAAVLDITPRSASTSSAKEKKPTQTETYPATFYFLYMDNGKPVTEKVDTSSEISAQDLLEPLFQHFHKNEQVYSAAIIDGHGSGFDMFYGKEGWFSLETILTSLKAANLKLDVLNLDSCHMGSFYNLHKLARYQNVSYLVASSDLMMGSSQTMYYTFLYQLKHTPRQAAINTTRSIQRIYSIRSDEPYNSLTLKLDSLSTPVLNWFNTYGMIMTAGSDELRQQMLRPFDPRWGEWRSFSKILRKQITYLQEHNETILWNGWEVPNLTQDFITNGEKLLQTLQDNTLTQWCYSAQHDNFFINRIPPNIDCTDGVSVTKNQLAELVKDEHRTIEKKLDEQAEVDWYWR